MGFISVSFYRTYSYFIFVWVLEITAALLKGYFELKYTEQIYFFTIIELFYLICLNIGDLLAGFLVLYTQINSKSEKKEEELMVKKRTKSSKIQIILIYNDLSIKKNKYYLILLISILEFVVRSTDFFYYLILATERIRDGEITWLISIDILSRFFFSKFILKGSIYKHHILSIVLTLFGLCSMSISAFFAIKSYEIANWPYFLFIITKFILSPLEDVINKILLINKFLLPHVLMFWRGVYIFGILLIMVPIVIFTKAIQFNKINFDTEGFNFVIQILLIILLIPILFLKSFFTMKVIYIFSPQHIGFLNVTLYTLRLLRCRIFSEDKIIYIIADLIFLMIIIFSSLLFNEMIIINACGFNENTKVGFLIKEKKEQETDSSQIDESEDINRSRDSYENDYD